MSEEQSKVRLKVEWKLEKFSGEIREGETPEPVEVIQGSELLPLFKEVNHGPD